MSNSPLVSIITPSYNQAEFLEETLTSVIGQDYANLEYIVIDGNSNDGSQEIIRKHERKITHWISESDQGQAEAINKGVDLAKGEIIAWLNSDDYYLPGAVNSAVRAFEQHSQVGLVYGDVQAVDEKSKQFNIIRYAQWGLQDLMQFNIIGQPSVFFRRRAWDEVGGLDQDLHYMLDHHLWLRMALHESMLYVPWLWSAARFHQSSKNVAQPRGFVDETRKLVNWMAETSQYQPCYHKYEKQISAGSERLIGRYLSEAGHSGQALKAFGRSFKANPKEALKDWKRILITITNSLGLAFVEKWFRNSRK